MKILRVILSQSCPLPRKRLRNTWNNKYIEILIFVSSAVISVSLCDRGYIFHLSFEKKYFVICSLASCSGLQVFRDKPYWQVFPGSCLNCTSWKTVNLFLLVLRKQQQPHSPKVSFIVILQPHLSPMSYKANLWKKTFLQLHF